MCTDCDGEGSCRTWDAWNYTRKGVLFSDAVKNCSFIYRGAMTEAHSYCDDVYGALPDRKDELCEYTEDDLTRERCLNFSVDQF